MLAPIVESLLSIPAGLDDDIGSVTLGNSPSLEGGRPLVAVRGVGGVSGTVVIFSFPDEYAESVGPIVARFLDEGSLSSEVRKFFMRVDMRRAKPGLSIVLVNVLRCVFEESGYIPRHRIFPRVSTIIQSFLATTAARPALSTTSQNHSRAMVL